MKTSLLGSLALSIILTGCAQHKTIPENQLDPSELKTEKGHETIEATSIQSWDLSGAMSARGASKAWSAQIHWQQSGAHEYQIRLFGPLGGGTVIIDGHKGRTTYTDGSKQISSKNPDALFEQQTGLRLPVQNLYYWVRGLPAPGPISAKTWGPNHTLSTLSQDGYSINYSNYTMTHQALLPTKIRLEGHGLLIKLVIKQWNI